MSSVDEQIYRSPRATAEAIASDAFTKWRECDGKEPWEIFLANIISAVSGTINRSPLPIHEKLTMRSAFSEKLYQLKSKHDATLPRPARRWWQFWK